MRSSTPSTSSTPETPAVRPRTSSPVSNPRYSRRSRPTKRRPGFPLARSCVGPVRSAARGVHRVDLVGVLGVDPATLELHRRGELLGIGEPLVAQHRELLDLLGVRERLVGALHLAGD